MIRVFYKVSRLSLEQDLEPLAEINQVFIKQLNRQTGSMSFSFVYFITSFPFNLMAKYAYMFPCNSSFVCLQNFSQQKFPRNLRCLQTMENESSLPQRLRTHFKQDSTWMTDPLNFQY